MPVLKPVPITPNDIITTIIANKYTNLFSIYIKSMGRDTVYRIEERKHPHVPAIDFINDVFNPIEKFELVRRELKQKQ